MAWLLARWMIDPRQETFLALPEWFRPTISQLYIPHVDLVDFLLWPALRDMITNRPDTLQKDWRWLDDMSRTIECDWFINFDLALETNPETGEVHLTETAKVRIWTQSGLNMHGKPRRAVLIVIIRDVPRVSKTGP